jgi:hypothetical protein
VVLTPLRYVLAKSDFLLRKSMKDIWGKCPVLSPTPLWVNSPSWRNKGWVKNKVAEGVGFGGFSAGFEVITD